MSWSFRERPLRENEYYSLSSIGGAPVDISAHHSPAELFIVGRGIIALNLAYRALRSNVWRGHPERIHVIGRSTGASWVALGMEFPVVEGDALFQEEQYKQIKNIMIASRMINEDIAERNTPEETGVMEIDHVELVEEDEWHPIFAESIIISHELLPLKEPLALRAPNGVVIEYPFVRVGRSRLIDPVPRMERLVDYLESEGVQFRDEEITPEQYRELNRHGGVTIQAAGVGGAALSEGTKLIPDYGASFTSSNVRLASGGGSETGLLLPDEAAVMLGAGAYVIAPRTTRRNNHCIVGAGGSWNLPPDDEKLKELRDRLIELGRFTIIAVNKNGTEVLLKAPTPESILQTLANPQYAARPSYVGGLDFGVEDGFRKKANGGSHGGVGLAAGLAIPVIRGAEDLQLQRWEEEARLGRCDDVSCNCRHNSIVVSPEVRALQKIFWDSGDTGLI